MSSLLLIIGPSGGGKSSSLRDMSPGKTFLVNVCRKELPFRSARKNYIKMNKSNPDGNMIYSDNYSDISKTLTYISNERPETNCIVIDDSQYLIVNEFLSKHSTQGKGNSVFDLYNQIADNFWKLIWSSKFLRDDLHVVFLHHSEVTEAGLIKAKTVGKMLDEKIDIPGMFTTVLYASREGDKNFFYTQNDGSSPAKSPFGMFDDIKIDNDLNFVINQINDYYLGE